MAIRKVDGQLTKVTEETAQELGQSLGMPAVTSPLQGATVGANPDQAKMLGSQMNMRSAIRARTTPETYDRAQRTQQYEREVTEKEKQDTADLKKYLANVPGIAKLDEEMAKKVAELLAPGGKPQEQLALIDWDSVPDIDQNDLSLLMSIAQDDMDSNTGLITNPSILTKALNGLPLDDDKGERNQLTKILDQVGFNLEELRNYVRSPEDELARQIAKARPENIRIGQLDPTTLTKLGLSDDYLQSLFGTDYKNATYADVKQRVESLQSVFADVKELKRISVDPFASPTMRREANKRLRELGHMGRRAQQEKVNDLEAQIEDGDTITIGDAVFEIEEILEDDDWEEALSVALTDEKAMERLEETQPELAEWLKTNRDALQTQFREATGRLAPGQSVLDSLLLDDEAVEDLEAEFGTFDPTEALAFQKELFGDIAYADLSPAQKQELNQKYTLAAEENFEALMNEFGVGTQFWSDYTEGLNIEELNEEDRELLAGEVKDAWIDNEYETSGYTTSAEEVRRIYTDAGIEVPKEVEALLNLSAQEWYEQQPKMGQLIQDATDAATEKATDEHNEALLAPYSALSPEAQRILGLWAPEGERIPEPEPGSVAARLPEFLNSLNSAAKTKATELSEHILTSGTFDADGFNSESMLIDYLQANKGGLKADHVSIKQLKDGFNKHVSEMQTAFPEGTKNFNADQMYSLLFPELGGSAEAISYLRSKEFKIGAVIMDYSKRPPRPKTNAFGKVIRSKTKFVSQLPEFLDKDRDGKLDSESDLLTRVKEGLLDPNLRKNLNLHSLEALGKSAMSIVNTDKQIIEAREIWKGKVDTARTEMETRPWNGYVEETNVGTLEFLFEQDSMLKYKPKGLTYSLGQIKSILKTTPQQWANYSTEHKEKIEEQLKLAIEWQNIWGNFRRVPETKEGIKTDSLPGSFIKINVGGGHGGPSGGGFGG